ncbi:MAG: nucleoside monophosphate kinase [Alphaproteobacteria bacterium]|nr:nucleoside monophosphate kinase [Alphaproteobacteria bacterium]
MENNKFPPRHIVMMGPPGSGKGTQSAILSEKLGINTYSAGELLREATLSGTPEGNAIKEIIDKGNLVPAEYIVNRIEAKIIKPENHKGYIIDGFPRTLDQAKVFEEMQQKPFFQENGLAVDLVILLQVPDEYVIDRIIGRSQCAKCGTLYHEKFKPTNVFGVCDVCGGKEFTRRADDTYETVVSRLRNYRRVTAPVIPYYEDKGLLVCVDGTGPIDVVSEKIRKIVGY